MAETTAEIPTLVIPDTPQFESQDGHGQGETFYGHDTKEDGENEQGEVEVPSAQQDPSEGLAGPAPTALEEGEQPGSSPKESQIVAGDTDALRRSDAMTEEDLQQMEELNFGTCKKCGQEQELDQCVVRGPSEMWCLACNAIYVMLKRNMRWPPKEFEGMDDVAQQQFFLRCQKEKEAAKKSQFAYSRVRETLTRVLVDEQIRLKKIAVGGTYLPLSVYRQRGYIIDSDFENRNPKQWSHGLNDWTFLLVETSIHEEDIKSTIEKSITECEKNIRKRKQEALTEKNPEELEAKSARTDMTVVMDLVSESEDEGGVGDLFHVHDLRANLYMLRTCVKNLFGFHSIHPYTVIKVDINQIGLMLFEKKQPGGPMGRPSTSSCVKNLLKFHSIHAYTVIKVGSKQIGVMLFERKQPGGPMGRPSTSSIYTQNISVWLISDGFRL